MPGELGRMIEQVAKDKGIGKNVIIDALKSAVLHAARKKLGIRREIESHYNEELGEIEIFEFKEVVNEVTNPQSQIHLKDALKLDPMSEEGDTLGIKIEVEDLGRIAAQQAKQVIINMIREAERENIHKEYKGREGELVYGIVRRFENRDMIVDLGRTEALIPEDQQIPKERFRPGDRIKCIVLEVLKVSSGPQIILSRVSPQFLIKLFKLEVPEMSDKLVEIRNAAREPGKRAKISVISNEPNIDPVGAFVGLKGSRVQAVVHELAGERIDIIPWSPDPTTFICNALTPANISRVIIDEESKAIEIIVPDDQLSLVIGKRGQNVRLAVKLTGWDIDIRSESEVAKFVEQVKEALSLIPGVGEVTARILYNEGYHSIEDIAMADEEALSSVSGLGIETAKKIKSGAQELLNSEKTGNKEKAPVEEEPIKEED